MGYDQATTSRVTGNPESIQELRRMLNDQFIPERLQGKVTDDYFSTYDLGVASRLILEGDLGMGNYECEDTVADLSSWFPELTFILTVNLFEDGRDETTFRAGEVVDTVHTDPEEEEEEWEEDEDEEGESDV